MTGMEVILAIIATALGSGGVVSWLHIRTERDKVDSETVRNTAEAQALIIKSLQDENRRLSSDISDLRQEVAELRGHLQAMERLKVQEIAHQTARRVVAELVGDPDIDVNGD